MKIGVIIVLDDNIEKKFEKLRAMDIPYCQLNCWEPYVVTEEMLERVKRAREEYGIEITSCWCGWSKPRIWNFSQGPHTLGIVPPVYREVRCQQLKRGADFAKKLGVTDVITHAGFIPENPMTTEYQTLIPALQDLAMHYKENGQNFLFETGQETPVTLLRAIEDVGTGNMGINLDPANLIMYGKGNPVDALDVFGKYVRSIHGKDGLYPTNGYELGKEVRMGDGKVNYPVFLEKLKEIGYDGPIIIEREISGEQQTEDIKYAKAYLEARI